MTLVRSVLAAFALVALVAVDPAGAIEFRGGQSVTIASGEIIDDDLYVTGETVRIEGLVRGDLIAAGREIVFTGAVLGDLIAAGQGVVVDGSVADDVRMAGMVLQLGEAAAVGDDVIAAGFSLEAVPASVVAGSVVFSGFQARLAGDVRERLLGEMALLSLEGALDQGGEISVQGAQTTPPFFRFIPSPIPIPTLPAGLTVSSDATIGGELIYTSATPAVAESASGNLVHVEVERAEKHEPGFGYRSLDVLQRWVGIAAVGLLLALLAPGWLSARIADIARSPLAAAGWGAGGLVVVPVSLFVLVAACVLVLVLLKIVGLSGLATGVLVAGLATLAAGAAAAWLVFGFVAPVAAAGWVGAWTAGRLPGDRGRTRRPVAAVLIGCAMLGGLALLPFLGGAAALLAAVLGFGAVASWLLRSVTEGAR